MCKVLVGNQVHLCLFAKADIASHIEIVYDYGDKPSRMEWRKYVCVYYFTALITTQNNVNGTTNPALRC